MNRFVVFLVFVVSVLIEYQQPRAFAQSKRGAGTPQRRPVRRGLGPAQVLELRFNRSAPQIGDLLPDAAGFDADGKPFQLRKLKGQHTVLVFGCLT